MESEERRKALTLSSSQFVADPSLFQRERASVRLPQ